MSKCIYKHTGQGEKCEGRVEWEHAFCYKTQINEAWAIVPCCTYHHRGAGLDKDFNKFMAIMRADIDDVQRRMPKHNWIQEKKYLQNKYKNVVIGRRF